MEKEEPVKKKKRRKKKRKKDMGSFFFNLTQLTMLCIFIGVCFVIFQTGSGSPTDYEDLHGRRFSDRPTGRSL